MKLPLLIIFTFVLTAAAAQDTLFLKVHFLYGSRPMKAFRSTESKWFGGILGGHVGIEGDDGQILNFVPSGKFHWFAKKDDRHSQFAEHGTQSFYSILGGSGDSVKKAVFYIPVNPSQKRQFDSISKAYLQQTPYDYALFGMRCGAAAYDILGHLGILPQYKTSKTYKKIFYPRKLRKRLFRRAAQYGWEVKGSEGSRRRKWEKD